MASSDPADIVRVDDLTVTYPDGTRAIDGISFRVRRGEFFGFLGPNGAGKSTAIKTLTTLLPRSSGRVEVAGHDVDREASAVRRAIGVLSQDTVVDVDLTGRENLALFGRLQHVPRAELEERVARLLRVVQLEEVADRPAGRYSGGMRKRLDLASALVHEPELLFLDEPTTGLDPQSRAALWAYLERINREKGVTIFLTTQYMEEADHLCGRLAIIDRGQLVGGGAPRELKAALGGDTIELTLEGPAADGNLGRAATVLQGIDGLGHVETRPGGVTARAPNAARILVVIVTALAKAGIYPSELSVSSPTLDDVFLQLTGHRIRSDELERKTTDPFLM